MSKPPPVNMLPPELLGKVFGYLDDEKRCKIVPLVCRAWLQAHTDHPPLREVWCIPGRTGFRGAVPGVTRAMVSWFLKIASNLKELQVEMACPDVACYLPHMLSMASLKAPNLRRLTLGMGGVQPVLHSLAHMSQLKVLRLREWTFPEKIDTSHSIAGLQGLCSLEELDLGTVYLEHAFPREADTLWESLATLQHLRTLKIVAANEDDYPQNSVPFFDELSLLTNISALHVWLGTEAMDFINHHYNIPDVFSTLTQLTAIDFSGMIQDVVFSPILDLPNLECLTLPANGEGWKNSQSIYLAAPKLSMLACSSDGLPLETFLVPESPALAILHTLVLADSLLATFPMSVAVKLTRLVVLNLAGNSFSNLPPSVVHLHNLRELDMSHNKNLQLEPSDRALLAALAHLTLLSLKREDENWSSESVRTIWSFSKRLPGLEIKI